MKCAACDSKSALEETTITHKYVECGLDNVTLVGVKQSKCNDCGEVFLNFGNADQLHGLLADLLLKKADLLSGKEVRFLRKYLGYSGAMFAKLLNYEPETISRLETGAQAITPQFDRTVRFAVFSKLPDRNYDLHDQILKSEGKNIALLKLKLSHGEWREDSKAA